LSQGQAVYTIKYIYELRNFRLKEHIFTERAGNIKHEQLVLPETYA
jgi:hypothetical protein